MKYFLIMTGIVLIALLFIFLRVRYYIHISKNLINNTVKFSNTSNDTTKTLLVLGDSTAYGVGASHNKDSLPALIASSTGATYVENHSISGAKIEDLPAQLEKIKKDQYDIIVLQIGANNIVARDNIDKESQKLEEIIKKLQKVSKRIIFLTAGNVGGAPAIPFPLRSYYRNLTLAYHEKFQILGDKLGVVYVNLYDEPSIDPFILHPEVYFAADMFHPSSDGYKLWFSKIKKYL